MSKLSELLRHNDLVHVARVRVLIRTCSYLYVFLCVRVLIRACSYSCVFLFVRVLENSSVGLKNHENIIDFFYHTKWPFVVDRMHVWADLAVGGLRATF